MDALDWFSIIIGLTMFLGLVVPLVAIGVISAWRWLIDVISWRK